MFGSGMQFTGVTSISGGVPLPANAAVNGLSVGPVSGAVELGNTSTGVSGPAKLLNQREIDVNGFFVRLLDLINGETIDIGNQGGIVAGINILNAALGFNVSMDRTGFFIADATNQGNYNEGGIQFANSATLFSCILSAALLSIIDNGSGRGSTLSEQSLQFINPVNGDSSQVADSIILQTNGATGLISSMTGAEIRSGSTFRSAQPSANGSGQWKLGKVLLGAVALDATKSVEVMIDGVLRKLLIAV